MTAALTEDFPEKNPSLTHRELLHEVTYVLYEITENTITDSNGSKVIGNLISAYKAFAPHKSSNIYAPKPHLSSLEYQVSILGQRIVFHPLSYPDRPKFMGYLYVKPSGET